MLLLVLKWVGNFSRFISVTSLTLGIPSRHDVNVKNPGDNASVVTLDIHFLASLFCDFPQPFVI